jgi:glycosyltransferase involved in cell wall biosynthesis
MMKLAIISTHPIQYYAPVFKMLQQSDNISIRVFYTLGPDTHTKYDPGFGKKISWDIPLLDGYDYEWVPNIAAKPGSNHFNGIKNPGLIKQIENWEPDAILVYGWAYDSHLKALRYFKNKLPVYFRGDSTLLNEAKGLKGIIKYFFLRWVYRHIDYAFYVGANNRAYYKKYGLKDHQLRFAPHAIDNDRFKADYSAEAAKLRSGLQIKEDDIIILFAGKFEPVKNIGLLLQSFINLQADNAHLLLVGNGINEPQLKEVTTAGANANNIHFLGFQNQAYIPAIYQAADLFCLPSVSETWGLSVNEAMACGKAVLVSDKVGCSVDLVKPGENGVIFKSGDLDDLTSSLNMLVKNGKSRLGRMGQRSKKIISCWSFENQVNAITSLINE